MPHEHGFEWHDIVGADYVRRVFMVSVTCASCGLKTQGTTPMPADHNPPVLPN